MREDRKKGKAGLTIFTSYLFSETPNLYNTLVDIQCQFASID